MRRQLPTRAGFTMIEMMVAGIVGILLSLGLFQFLIHSTRGSKRAESLTLAQHLLDDMMKSVKTNFQRRYWGFPATNFFGGVLGITPGILLSAPPGNVFNINLGGPKSFRCPPPDRALPPGQVQNMTPSCENLTIIQTITQPAGNPDIYRRVEFETTCQNAATSPALPSNFSSEHIQFDGLGCTTPPVASLRVGVFPGVGVPTQTFVGETNVGSALCFRSCIVSPAAGPTKLAIVDYYVEAAVIYRTEISDNARTTTQGVAGSEDMERTWKGLKANFIVSTADAAEGIEVLNR